MAGTAALLREEDLGCADLRRMVTSPGGTTRAALDVLMADDGLAEIDARKICLQGARLQHSRYRR